MKKFNSSNLSLIDLTHTVSSSIPSWDGECGFRLKTLHDYVEGSKELGFRGQYVEMQAGIGTHIDSPSHCIPHAMNVAEIPLEKLFSPCVKIDVSAKANADYCVSAEDITEFEKIHGKIASGSFVIIYSGWDQYWNEPLKYRNNLQFPTLSEFAAEILLARDVNGVGIDTLSPDSGTSGYPVHRLMLGAGKYIIENIANAASLPNVGASTLALPMKIENGAEAPVRLIAIS